MTDKSSDKSSENKVYDPFEPWRALRDAGTDAWAKTMIEYVNSESYSKVTGAMLDSYLVGSAPFRELLEKTMVRSLEQLGMPTRADFISLAKRLTNIEMRLDDMDAKLDRMESNRAEMTSAPTREKKEGK